jgi:dTMP kinase
MKINLPLFIVIEGIDGSGKSTLCENLFKLFINSGIPCVLNQEPTDGYWGKEIRKKLKQENTSAENFLELFIKDREDDVNKNILPCLEQKKLLLLHRYYYSNAAYQGAMGLSYKNIITENRKRNFPEPDRVYLLDLNPETAINRITARNKGTEIEVFEKLEMLKNVRDIYSSIADEKFLFIDAAKNIDEITGIVTEDIMENFGRK